MYTSQKVYSREEDKTKICLDKWWSGILQVPCVYNRCRRYQLFVVETVRDNSHWIYGNKHRVLIFHITFNIMNELLRKECDVSCNFIFLSNCMTKWFLHSLGIIYWRGFGASSFFFAAVLLLQMPLRCSHHHLRSVGLVYRHTLEWFKDNLINENLDGSRLFHILLDVFTREFLRLYTP